MITTQNEPIRLWRFHDAPEEYQSLSEHGGDEDYVMHVPAYLVENRIVDFITTTNGLGAFGICDTSEHPLPDGSKVFIGAHA